MARSLRDTRADLAARTFRLLPHDPGSWRWFPAFEQRVVDFHQRYGNAGSEAALRHDLRIKWITAPMSTGYWLVFSPDGQPIGHAWMSLRMEYDQPIIWGHQASCDKGKSLGGLYGAVVTAAGEWASAINSLIPKGKPKLTRITTETFRSGDVYERFLTAKGIKVHRKYERLEIEV